MAEYFNALDHAVYFTLAYSDGFNFPLTKEEIIERLPVVWDWPYLTDQRIKTQKLLLDSSEDSVEKSLLNLEKKQKIEKKQLKNTNYYFLKNRQQLPAQRLKKQEIAQLRQTAIDQVSNYLSKFPTITALALTGASAVDNAKLDDDLDFCIIVKKNTLWITRFFVILLTKILHKQPQIIIQPTKNNKQAWCFNLWLDENKLNMAKRGLSIFQSYELKQMSWLFDRADIKKKILLANPQLVSLIDLASQNNSAVIVSDNIFDYLKKLLNYLFYLTQGSYRYFKFGKENYDLSLYQAHFNDLSRQKHIFQKIKRKMTRNDFSDF